jgi:biotin carboxylase
MGGSRDRKRIMIVAAGWKQLPMIEEAKRQGYFVIAVDGNSEAYGLEYAHKAYTISTRDKDRVLEVARSEGIHAITYMITESPIMAVHHVASTLGLPGPTAESVAATVNKLRMREILETFDIPNPRFGKAVSKEESINLAKRIGVPLVMKPADVGGQLGLFKITELEDVGRYFDASQAHAIDGEVILEEWMNGVEMNVVAVVLKGEIQSMTISDRVKHPKMAFGVVMRHIYPADCKPQTAAVVRELSQRVATAMRIQNGIIFPQFIITDEGPRLVEIGERIPGGIMMELFDLATGCDLVKLQIDMALGRSIHLAEYRVREPHEAVSVKFLTAEPGPLKPGRVSIVTGLAEILELNNIIDAQYYNDPSKPQVIRPLREGRDRFFYIIGVGSNRTEAVQATDRASDMLDFRDEAGRSLKAV